MQRDKTSSRVSMFFNKHRDKLHPQTKSVNSIPSRWKFVIGTMIGSGTGLFILLMWTCGSIDDKSSCNGSSSPNSTVGLHGRMAIVGSDSEQKSSAYCRSKDCKTVSCSSISGSLNPGQFASDYLSTTFRDQEGLSKAQQAQLRMAFDAFDPEKSGKIPADMLGTILGMMGKQQDSRTLNALIGEIELENEGELNYEEFTMLASRFLEEEYDTEAMQQELREAFRLYDREGNGYITTEVFRDILHELDENLTDDELDMMIDEIDADGSGTLDFDEFVEAMTH